MSTDAGIKHDHGKPRVSLVVHGFARALMEVSAVATFGAEKYSANGWVSVPNGCERYTDAMYRHLLAEAAGQQCDAESGLAHAAHAAWCALARLELMLREEEAWCAAQKDAPLARIVELACAQLEHQAQKWEKA